MSQYLVQGVEAERFASESFKGNPYPAGLEREAINRAFDRLFEVMQPKETERGVMLFRKEGPLHAKHSELPAGAQPRGMAVEAVQAEVDKFKARYRGAQPLHIVITHTQDEAFGRHSIARHGALKGGFDFDSDTLYIVAGHIENLRDLQATLQHELWGHKGFRLLPKEKFARLLDELVQAVRSDTDPELTRLWESVAETYENETDPRVIAEEVIAHAAEHHVRHGVIRKILDKIREILRQAFGWQLTLRDVEALIEASARNLERGKPAKTPAVAKGAGPLFSREGNHKVEENIRRGLEAMNKVIAEHVDVRDAMHRDEVRSISLLLGQAGRSEP